MVDNPSLNRPLGSASVNPTGPVTPGSKPDEAGKGGPAFQALLDKLQEKSRVLSKDSENVDKPEELSGAVDRARSTLNDALSLSDKLLEAYRQAAQEKDGDESA